MSIGVYENRQGKSSRRRAAHLEAKWAFLCRLQNERRFLLLSRFSQLLGKIVAKGTYAVGAKGDAPTTRALEVFGSSENSEHEQGSEEGPKHPGRE